MRKPENGGDASPVKEIIAQISELVKTLDYSSLTFYLCLRIGELVSIKKEDIQGNEIFINRSTKRHQKMNDDLSFGKTEYTVEERIKGNQKEGFRSIPLTKRLKR